MGLALRGFTLTLQEAADAVAREGALHPTDFACIRYLHWRNEPVSIKDITAHLRLSSGSGTALLDRLERAGYVHREPNPADRRGVLILLNHEAARKPITKFLSVQRAFHAAIADFTPEELEAIARFLERATVLASPA